MNKKKLSKRVNLLQGLAEEYSNERLEIISDIMVRLQDIKSSVEDTEDAANKALDWACEESLAVNPKQYNFIESFLEETLGEDIFERMVEKAKEYL